MFVHYTTASGHPAKVGWLMRILICSGIALWMLALSGAVATSSADTINPNNGPIRLSVPLSEQVGCTI